MLDLFGNSQPERYRPMKYITLQNFSILAILLFISPVLLPLIGCLAYVLGLMLAIVGPFAAVAYGIGCLCDRMRVN